MDTVTTQRWATAEGMRSWPWPSRPLQYQYASGKNTADIAIALDALDILFDERADTFCLVTSGSINPASGSPSVQEASSQIK
jgi:hypothetical protein